jgi:hypothetical protein
MKYNRFGSFDERRVKNGAAREPGSFEAKAAATSLKCPHASYQPVVETVPRLVFPDRSGFASPVVGFG